MMQPREIDLQVALALGARLEYDHKDKELLPGTFRYIHPNGWPGTIWSSKEALMEPSHSEELRYYSEDLTAAFTVGEKLWPDGWGVKKEHGLWQAGPMYLPFYDTGECMRAIEPLAEADTPAMAICLAALKCKGVDVGE